MLLKRQQWGEALCLHAEFDLYFHHDLTVDPSRAFPFVKLPFMKQGPGPHMLDHFRNALEPKEISNKKKEKPKAFAHCRTVKGFLVSAQRREGFNDYG